MSRILSTGGVSASVHAGIPPGQTPLPGQTPPWQSLQRAVCILLECILVCINFPLSPGLQLNSQFFAVSIKVTDLIFLPILAGGVSVQRGGLCPGGLCPGRPPSYSKEWAVRILLECILVLNCCHMLKI